MDVATTEAVFFQKKVGQVVHTTDITVTLHLGKLSPFSKLLNGFGIGSWILDWVKRVFDFEAPPPMVIPRQFECWLTRLNQVL
jgi:hypothetical protein